MANVTTQAGVGSAVPTNTVAAPVASNQAADVLASQNNISPQTMQDYQKKYPTANPDALIGSILMDKQKASPVPKPAPTVITSEQARNTADKQINDIVKIAGGGSYGSPGDAKANGYMGNLAFNPSTNRYEPANDQAGSQADKQASQATQATQTAELTGNDAMSQSILDQLMARPAAIDLATQNQIKTIQEIMGRRRDEMQRLNQAQQGATDKLGAATGRSRYAPDIQAGIVSDTAAKGLQRVAEIDAQEQQLIGEARSQAEEKKFAALGKTYEFMQSLKKEKADALKTVKEEMAAADKLKTEKRKEYDVDAEKTISNLVEAGYEADDSDILSIAAKYDQDPLEVKLSYEAKAKKAKTKDVTDQLQLKKLNLELANDTFDNLSRAPAGTTVTLNGVSHINSGKSGVIEVNQATGSGYIVSKDPVTGEYLGTNMGYVGSVKDGFQPTKDQYGNLWNVNPETGQKFKLFTTPAVQTIAAVYPDGSQSPFRPANDPYQGECAAWNNDCNDPSVGKIWGSTLEDKKRVLKNSGYEIPKADALKGDVQFADTVIMYAGSTGHTARVIDTAQIDGKTYITLSESNYIPPGGGKISNTRQIPVDDPSIVGFARVPTRPEFQAGPDSPLTNAVLGGTKVAANMSSEPVFAGLTTKAEREAQKEKSKRISGSDLKIYRDEGYDVTPSTTYGELDGLISKKTSSEVDPAVVNELAQQYAEATSPSEKETVLKQAKAAGLSENSVIKGSIPVTKSLKEEKKVVAKSIALDRVQSLQSLLSNKLGLETSVGPNFLSRGATSRFFDWSGALPGGASIKQLLNPEETQRFNAGTDQLISSLALKSLTDLKASGATLGALSDTELAILMKSATNLKSYAKYKDGNLSHFATSEKNVMDELSRIQGLMELDYVRASFGKNSDETIPVILKSSGEPGEIKASEFDGKKYKLLLE